MAIITLYLLENIVFVIEQKIQVEEVADMHTSLDTDDELSDNEDKDTMQLTDDVSAPITCQHSGDNSNEESNKEKRDIGAAPTQSLQTSAPSETLGRNGSIWTSSPITLLEERRHAMFSLPLLEYLVLYLQQ